MAGDKIDQNPQNSKEIKKISFLATGSEIIQGDLHESNCYCFAKAVSKKGAEIYQHVHASDKKDEICSAIHHLLDRSDALIITGGLGPTSDDNTRFAVADYTQQKLYFDEQVWESILSRLKRFNLRISESNRQQAFFPIASVLYPNKNGSAFGFYLKWQNKLIFVLPGPPKECTPLFEEYVMPTLQNEGFLHKKSILCWSTLGLVESEIASRVDDLSKNYNVETAYRWHYPYLDIKIISEIYPSEIKVQQGASERRVEPPQPSAKAAQRREAHTQATSNDAASLFPMAIHEPIQELVQKIDLLLKSYLVSYDRKNAFEILETSLNSITNTIYIFDNLTHGEFSQKIKNEKLKFISTKNEIEANQIHFNLGASRDLKHDHSEYSGTVIFNCSGFLENEKVYSHEISVPYRNKEILDYANHYAAWQLNKFIESLNGKTPYTHLHFRWV